MSQSLHELIFFQAVCSLFTVIMISTFENVRLGLLNEIFCDVSTQHAILVYMGAQANDTSNRNVHDYKE